jgi:hypothetical protein
MPHAPVDLRFLYADRSAFGRDTALGNFLRDLLFCSSRYGFRWSRSYDLTNFSGQSLFILFFVHYAGYPLSRFLKASLKGWVDVAGFVALGGLLFVFLQGPDDDPEPDYYLNYWFPVYLILLLLFPVYGFVSSIWQRQQPDVS